MQESHVFEKADTNEAFMSLGFQNQAMFLWKLEKIGAT